MHNFMNKLMERASRRISAETKIHPVARKKVLTPDITISRDPGSGGKLIAKKVATKLGWKFFDRSLMIKLADELGIPPKEFANVDEHSRNWIYDSFQSLLNPNYVSDLKYIAHLKKILIHGAKNTDLVILGRGANHILDPKQCLRVRITASFSNRVAKTVEFENRDREDAADWVRKVEHKRVSFIKQYFNVNPYNPWHYDLVINTDTLSLDQARDIIIQAYFTKFPSERRRLARKMS